MPTETILLKRLIQSIALIIFVVIFVGCNYLLIESNKETKQPELVQREVSESKNTENISTADSEVNPKNAEEIIKHEVVYTLENKRFDKGLSFYILIDPVDLSSPVFIDSIKELVNFFVKENGEKISIEFHDSRESLDLNYKLYGELSLDRNTTKEENEFLAVHHIASYSGDLSTGLFRNTLYLFPNADSQNELVGKYVLIEEFNPEI